MADERENTVPRAERRDAIRDVLGNKNRPGIGGFNAPDGGRVDELREAERMLRRGVRCGTWIRRDTVKLLRCVRSRGACPSLEEIRRDTGLSRSRILCGAARICRLGGADYFFRKRTESWLREQRAYAEERRRRREFAGGEGT